jgi:hypothetical protein
MKQQRKTHHIDSAETARKTTAAHYTPRRHPEQVATNGQRTVNTRKKQ